MLDVRGGTPAKGVDETCLLPYNKGYINEDIGAHTYD